jgi:hypothetical protein
MASGAPLERRRLVAAVPLQGVQLALGLHLSWIGGTQKENYRCAFVEEGEDVWGGRPRRLTKVFQKVHGIFDCT